MTTLTPPDPHKTAIEERIHDLLVWRCWYRNHPGWGAFLDLSREHTAELRALVAVARRARRMTPPDPMTLAKASAWTESELREAHGG